MKRTNLAAAVLLAVFAAALAACGGSDDAGSITPFSLSNESLAVKAVTGTPADVCVPGNAGLVFVYGGAAPYQLDNTAPDAVVLNPTSQVAHPGDSFTVDVTGICGTFTIIVNDKLGKQVKLKVTNSPA